MYVTQEFINNVIVDPSTGSGQMEVLWANGHLSPFILSLSKEACRRIEGLNSQLVKRK